MPAVTEMLRKFFGREPIRSINPDEVVGMGAAIQGAVLENTTESVLLLDVTPLTLGIETMGGITTPLIPRNTRIPVTCSQVFSTARDNQESVEISVVQGERRMASDNRTLAEFVLEGIPPAPKGVPQIEVAFNVNADGILSVRAVDLGTGAERRITVQSAAGLSDGEVDRLVKEARRFDEADLLRQRLAELRSRAESLLVAARRIADEADQADAHELIGVAQALEIAIVHGTPDELSVNARALEELLRSRAGEEMRNRIDDQAQRARTIERN
jgi:molecular chaperone DnaK